MFINRLGLQSFITARRLLARDANAMAAFLPSSIYRPVNMRLGGRCDIMTGPTVHLSSRLMGTKRLEAWRLE